MIEFKNAGKSFDGGKTFAVKDVSFTVEEGETVVILGSSGCGKTTTLKMINRLLDATEGTVLVGGDDVMNHDPVELRRSMGYVFQGIGLFPLMTVRKNVEIVARLLGWSSEEREERSRELLEMVGLPFDDYADRYPDELSGGQQQRVGVARALATDPDYLLMDEPFGALDALTRDALQQELLKLKEQLDKTIVFVTHDIFEALIIADRMVILHDGELQQVGTQSDVMNNPATDFVRELFEKPAKQLEAYRGKS